MCSAAWVPCVATCSSAGCSSSRVLRVPAGVGFRILAMVQSFRLLEQAQEGWAVKVLLFLGILQWNVRAFLTSHCPACTFRTRSHQRLSTLHVASRPPGFVLPRALAERVAEELAFPDGVSASPFRQPGFEPVTLVCFSSSWILASGRPGSVPLRCWDPWERAACRACRRCVGTTFHHFLLGH